MLTNNPFPELVKSQGSLLSESVHAARGTRLRERGQDAQENTTFERVYREVAQENRRAKDNRHQVDRSTEGKPERTSQQFAAPTRRREPLSSRESIEPEFVDKAAVHENASAESDVGNANMAVQEASRIIREALEEVSATLNLDIVADLKIIDNGDLSAANVEQLAEIVQALKAISEILVQAIEQNQPLTIKDVTFAPEQMVEVEQTLRVQLFKVELACTTTGLSEEVAARAMEQQHSFQGLGIPQAVDLSTKTMPVVQLRQLLDGMVRTREDEVKHLVRALGIALEKIGDSSAMPATLETPVVKAVNPADLMPHGTTVMRSILKIDAKELTISENLGASKRIEKMDTAGVFSDLMHKDIGGLLSRNDATVMPVLDLMGKKDGWESLSSLLGPKTAQTLLKHVEQNVMTQLVDRLSTVVRNGGTEMRLTLRPESLGEVSIKVEIHGDLVSAKIHVENQQVKQIVENNLQSLKSALEEHHLQAGEFDVNVNHGHDQAKQQSWDNTGTHSEAPVGNASSEEDMTGTVVSGSDTGRRFGTNSMEIIA